MTPTETVALTKYAHALCPHQAIDDYTPDAWHDVLGNASLAECRAAVITLKSRGRVFIDPAEIITEIRRASSHRAQRERTEALIAPVRLQRSELTDPRPLRSAIRELLASHGLKRLERGS
jgi:hypothetical protein